MSFGFRVSLTINPKFSDILEVAVHLLSPKTVTCRNPRLMQHY